jgi:hypothetical protein
MDLFIMNHNNDDEIDKLIYENKDGDTSSFALNVLYKRLEEAASVNHYVGVKTEWTQLHEYYKQAGWVVEEIDMDFYTLLKFSI